MLLQLEILQDSAEIRLEISAVKRQFVDILGSLAAATQTQAGRDAALTSSTFSRRRRRQYSTSQDTSTSSSSSPKPKRLSDGHLFPATTTTTTTMRRSCAAAVLACSARTKPPSDSAKIDQNNDPRRCLRPTRRPTLSVRRRLSEDKENIADSEQPQSGELPFSVGVCRPDIRSRLFPDLNEDEELQCSGLVRTSSAVCEEYDRQATSTTMTLEDVSAISRTYDGEGDVLRRVRSTTSMSSLNGAFCSSSGDVEDDATATASGAFCSTFSYPLHSTVIDSFFDVSALLPPRPPSSPNASHSPSQFDEHAVDSSQNPGRRRSTAKCCEDSPHPRSFKDSDRRKLLVGDVSSGYQLVTAADNDRRRTSQTVEPRSPPSASEFDLARTSDANCTARLRRQMGQTRLHTTNNSSSSQRQSDFTSSRLNVDYDGSRSTLFECGCAAEQRLRRPPTAVDDDEYRSALPPTSTNFSLSRTDRRETSACFTDTCRSWSSDRRRMTMHCAPAVGNDALFTDRGVRHDRRPIVVDDRRQTVNGQLRFLPHRRPADERSDRRQRVSAATGDRVSGGGGGCPLCGCGRAPAGDAVDRRRSRTPKLTSSNCDDVAAERRRKRALLRKLRRFSDAFYGNSDGVQLKTFGHF